MLTLKLITEETDRVIRGLEKKHFKGAKEAIDEVLAVDKKRREAQQQLDKNLSEAKKMAAQIGGLMKEGNYINYVKGANVAGFMKVAKAMLAQGIV